tara:strand:- start:138 stop:1184 length:1047 start_codon:yes stop_codon:yes gene_type:complete
MSKTILSEEYKFDNIHYFELAAYYPKLSKILINNSLLKFFLYPLWFFFAYRLSVQIINKSKPDILHGGYVPIVGFLCSLINFRPFLLMPWGSDILIFPDKSLLHNLFINRIISKSDAIVCDAEVVKKKILEIYPYKNPLEVFPWGIDLSKFKKYEDETIAKQYFLEKSVVIISTRNHEKIYGIEILLEAFSILKRKSSSAKLLLLGSGSLTGSYLEHIKKDNLEDSVKMIGRIPNSDLPIFLNNSDIYVSTSFSDGTSVSLLEGMACGLPVVVSDIPSNKEWITNGENGFIFSKGDSKDLSKKLLHLVKDSDLRLKQSKINQDITALRADWDINFATLQKVYKALHNN